MVKLQKKQLTHVKKVDLQRKKERKVKWTSDDLEKAINKATLAEEKKQNNNYCRKTEIHQPKKQNTMK